MIEIKLQFRSYEEALLAVGRLAGLEPQRQQITHDPHVINATVIESTVSQTAQPVSRSTEAAAVKAPDPQSGTGREPGAVDTSKKLRGRSRKNATAAGATPGQGDKGGNASTATTDPGKAVVAATPTSTVPAATVAPETAAPASVGSLPATNVAAQAPVAAAPMTAEQLETAQKALEAAHDKIGTKKCLALLNRFGVKRVRELKAIQYEEFVKDAGRAQRGEYDPEAAA